VIRVPPGSSGTIITLISMAVVGGVLVLAMGIACFRHYSLQVASGKLGLQPEGGADTHFDYQDRLQKEWEALCSYLAEPCSVAVAQEAANIDRNRHAEALPYFLVRSFYLKNVQTQETRTLTQFHLLSWPGDGIPTSTRPLLDFRRKVNKCYRGRSCPIIVHCR
ncbi:hypothetical protein XENOCAPTIV_012974, partial [Xenoophorus captivus]